MTDPTHDPEMTPLSLVQQLRLTADDLTSTYVAVDADGDPIGERPLDGSEEDFDDPLEPVEFEPEALHDMAALYRNAADELEEAALLREQASAEIARLTEALGASADPPNRAPLLATLEEIAGPELASACGNGMVALIRDAIAAIRTDARVIEAAREKLKSPATYFEPAKDTRDHHADLRHAMGHTARKPTSAEVEPHADLQRLAGAGPLQLSEGADDLVATCLWELLEAIEKTDPTDTEMSKVQFRGTVRGLANRRHALMSEVAVRESGGRVLQLALDSDAADQGPAPSDPPSPPGYTPWISMGNSGWALDGVRVADDVIGAWAHYAGRWTSWARELAGCSDGTDEELRGYIARLVGRLHALRAQNLDKLDSPQ